MLIVTRGLPASGKTTHAIRQGMTRVNRDMLRLMLHGRWIGTDEAEHEVTIAEQVLVGGLLAARVGLIVDDCNLFPGALETWFDLARRTGHQFLVHDFTHVDVEVCVRRAAGRGEGEAGEDVIRRMHRKYFPLAELDEPLKSHIRSVHGTPSEEITMAQGYSGEHEAAAIETDTENAPAEGTPAAEVETGEQAAENL
jgi:predicted kinase